jgi:hypothetical protein
MTRAESTIITTSKKTRPQHHSSIPKYKQKMSAAAARRKKQLAAKRALQTADQDPIEARLTELLASEECHEEATAYEALQLAQSQVRRHIKGGALDKATEVAFESSRILLEAHGRVAVTSQLLNVLVQVLVETHTTTTCRTNWVERIALLDGLYQTALLQVEDSVEKDRLGRLQITFLRKCLKWSNDLGDTTYGSIPLHKLLGQQCWRMASDAATAESAPAQTYANDEDDDFESAWALQNDAVTHMALAEEPLVLSEWFQTLAQPTKAQIKKGHECAPADRDALLTRAIMVFLTLKNLRDANVLLTEYATMEERDVSDLAKSYMDKKDDQAPSHITFCTMLVKVCEKDAKTGPLYSWLLRSFSTELSKLYKSQDVIASYTSKIGRVYFNIQPPPSMMSMMENMMGMMGGGGGGGGINPAMMQAAMAAQQH